MSYSSQAALSADFDFLVRVAACAQQEITLNGIPAVQWAGENIWEVAAAPGFADKYEYALATGVPRPGNDSTVISDADILSVVQPMGAGTS